MSKVFRIHDGNSNIHDWGASGRFDRTIIDSIKDPNGIKTSKEITSIPSPFARIDLVKTAFREVVFNIDNPDGDTIYHKMVSDCLDIGEIFFNYDKLKDKVDILFWDKNRDLNSLKDDGNDHHKIVYNTLNKFLEQDKDSYNFDIMQGLYMLNYIGPDRPGEINIIGATSPATLFFSTANNMDYVSKNISFGNDKPFDSDYQPLYKRDFKYVKYLFWLRKSYINFANRFPEFNEYLERHTYPKMSNNQKREIDNINIEDMTDYEVITINKGANTVGVVDGLSLYKTIKTAIISEFEIIPSNEIVKRKPLVLPVTEGNTYNSLKYTTDNWNANIRAPYYDAESNLDKRRLPLVQDEYPYLTISDFLQNSIIRMPYKLNSDFYFNGNFNENSDKNNDCSYLLPLTERFFEYFTSDDLKRRMPDNKPMIEIRQNPGGVSVILRIPIKGNNTIKYVEYNKMFFNNTIADATTNKGGVIDKKFGMAIMPLSNTMLNSMNNIRVAMFDKGINDVQLEFYSKNSIITSKNKKRRGKDNEYTCTIETYVIDKMFDRISVKISDCSGYVLPIINNNTGQNQSFTFAVDFGTTNTHIEYSVDGYPSQSFDIQSDEKQIQKLHTDYKDDIDIAAAFANNFIPDTIDKTRDINSVYVFPIRSVFAESNIIDYNKEIFAMADGNIPFRYEKAANPKYNTIKTNIKWSNGNNAILRMYIENIIILLRNKVILNNGNLINTKIIWFYPASMIPAHQDRISKIWNDLCKIYFNNDNPNVVSISESTAPYIYYSKKKGAATDVVTIDVGGGTTDVYMVENDVPKMLSSFRFASNAIFGDGYNNSADNNGFIKVYKDDFEKVLDVNSMRDKLGAFNDIVAKKNSADICAFFFSLSADNNIEELNFLNKLSENNKLKYVFLLFYSALIYFIAKQMKAKGLKKPRTIAFSGNGSKTLSILSPNNNTISNYVKTIFEKVYGEQYNQNQSLSIIHEDEPKKATCKGGILADDQTILANNEVNDIKDTLLGIDEKSFVKDIDRSYESITDNEIKAVVNNVEEFINVIFEMGKKNNYFVDSFGVDGAIFDRVKSLCKQNLENYLNRGINSKIDDIKKWGAIDNINESLFFYPIIGMLNNVARVIPTL